MATIKARKKADGTISYTVQIRLKKKGALVYQEAQIFARKQAAKAWAKRRETGLAKVDRDIPRVSTHSNRPWKVANAQKR